jgi:hypothetical protein
MLNEGSLVNIEIIIRADFLKIRAKSHPVDIAKNMPAAHAYGSFLSAAFAQELSRKSALLPSATSQHRAAVVLPPSRRRRLAIIIY